MTAGEYLRRVGFELRDLPWSMRCKLASELRDHLAELPEGTELGERLGPPESYAADLRAAAGLERRRGPIAFLRARRPRNVVLTVIALTLVGLAIGAVGWVDGYEPLATGNSWMNPVGVVNPPTGGPYTMVRLGKPFRYGFSLRNDGRFTVHILGVPRLYGLPFVARVMMSGPTRNGGMPLPSGPFRPLDLKPGYTLDLYFLGHYRCTYQAGAGAMYTLSSVPVRYRFLWRTGTAMIALPDQLVLILPKGVGCPSNRHPPPSTP